MTAAEGTSTPPTPPASLVGSALAGGRYLIEDEIAAGGMGEVYRARDTKLGRPVAVKRIAPLLGSDPKVRERFHKEWERQARLVDSRIAALYDVIEDRGEVFLVMELVSGTTLRQQLNRLDGRPLGTREGLAIGIQCARALESAHARGVLHCDLKPENIMVLPNNDVKILDFGLAHALPRRGQPGDPTRAMESAALASAGTPAYMPPESLQGKEMDARSDLYSLGVVLYELLVGRNPFAASTSAAIQNRVLSETPTPARVARPDISRALSSFLNRLMAKVPDERFESASVVVNELSRHRSDLERTDTKRRDRWVLATGLFVLVAGSILAIRPARNELGKVLGIIPRLPEQKHVVVLPFRDVREGEELKPFLDGLTYIVTGKLTSLEPYARAFDVVSAQEVLSEGVSSLEDARNRFGATLVITGSVQKSDLGLRVTAEIVDPIRKRIVRAMSPIDMDAGETSLLQDRVAVAVADLLELELRGNAPRLLRVGQTSNVQANEAYIEARGLLARFDDPANLDRSIEGFRRATKLDPAFASAWAGLGESYWRQYETTRVAEWAHEARAASERALGIDPQLAAGHTGLGYVHNGSGNYELAVQEFEAALRIDPSSSDAYRGLASAYQALGRAEEAEKLFRRAIELYPAYWAGYNWLGTFLLREGRYKEAEETFRRLVAIAPGNPRGLQNLGVALYQQGRVEESLAAFEQSLKLVPDFRVYGNVASIYMDRGQFVDAARIYGQALALNPAAHQYWGYLAECYAEVPDSAAKGPAAWSMAARLARQQLEVNPRDPDVLARLATYEANLQNSEEARKLAEQSLRTGTPAAQTLVIAAIAFERLGERNRALELLRSALKRGYSIEEVKQIHSLAQLRQDPRFQQLILPGL